MHLCDKCGLTATVQTESGKFSLCTNCFGNMHPAAIATDFQIIPQLVGWKLISELIPRHEEAPVQEDLMYSPLEAAVELVTRIAPLELELQKLQIRGRLPETPTLDPEMIRLLDKCMKYIDSQIPQVAANGSTATE